LGRGKFDAPLLAAGALTCEKNLEKAAFICYYVNAAFFFAGNYIHSRENSCRVIMLGNR